MAVYKRVYDKNRWHEKGLIRSETSYGEPVYFEISHVGLVVDQGRDYIGDGDFSHWAMVWNADKGIFEKVYYGTSYGGGRCEIDAPPELLAAWDAEKERREIEAERVRREQRERALRRGSIVRVAKGRKFPIGRQGRVFWIGESIWGLRAGVEWDDGGRDFIAADNLEVLAQTLP